MVKWYHKLVRDKIPEIIRNDNHTPYTHIATGSELEKALWDKLEEEVNEFKELYDTNELADVLEVIYAISEFYGINQTELDEMRRKKSEEKGGFNLGIILEKVE